MKIGIVGAGQVGATAAYAMMMRGVGVEIVLVDRKADLAVAQARDILDATPFAHPVRVRAGEMADLDGAGIVVLAAGAVQKPGESRLDLLSRNAAIFAEIVPALLAAAPGTIFLVATNPLDIITQIVTVLAGRHGVPPERVIGSGTILNSARFRTLLAAHLGISPAYIDARVLGEHGDSAVLHWSGAVAGNLSAADAARQMGRELTEADRSRIDDAVRRAAYAIIQGKGADLVRRRRRPRPDSSGHSGRRAGADHLLHVDGGMPWRARRGPVPAARARRGRRGEDFHAKSRRWGARRIEAERRDIEESRGRGADLKSPRGRA